jgi:aspartate/glutamate racemase
MHLGDDTVNRDNLAAEVGTIPKVNYFKFVTYARFLEEAGVDLILLGCSTFNRAVEYARPMIEVPMLQIDRPMMDSAVREGPRVGLLATLPSTVPSSERLLRMAAEEAGKEVKIKTILCSEAFKVLRAGNPDKHNQILLEEIEKLSKGVDAIVMAQVSMSVLEPHLANTCVPVYNSGRTGFSKVREILESL